MTKFTIEDSANYAAQVVRVPAPFPLPNADRLLGISIFGFTIITAKGGIQEGDLAVFFPAEAQLSLPFTAGANLHRHSDLNVDPTKTGYLEDNRRVRALKLRGTTSSGLLLPVEEVAAVFGKPVGDFTEGVSFDTIDGVEVSRKYRVKEPVVVDREGRKIKQAFKRVDSTLLPEHIETDQWLRNEHMIDDDDILIVSQKLHGTSARLANTVVRRELKWWERALVRLGVDVSTTSYDTVAGSRRSIKDPNNPNLQHFYGDGGDVWTDYLKRIEQTIPKGYVIYGEIVGFTKGGGPIQAGHTYGEQPGENRLYVYRVATVNPDGLISDLSWDQVRVFCQSRGLDTVPELWRGFKRDFDLALFVEQDFGLEHTYALDMGGLYVDRPVPLSKGGTGKDEGIAIRVERGGAVPLLFKYKNESHYLYETAQLDAGVVDLESQDAVPV
jgi:hypothetical protein